MKIFMETALEYSFSLFRFFTLHFKENETESQYIVTELLGKKDNLELSAM